MCAKLLMSSPVVIRVCFPYCPLDENSLNKKQPRSPEGVSQKATFGFFVHWLKWHLDMSPKQDIICSCSFVYCKGKSSQNLEREEAFDLEDNACRV